MRTYLISGAGSGIGKAMAETLATNAQHRILLLGRTQEKLEEVLRTLPHPENHSVILADVTDAKAIGASLEKAGVKDLYAVIANAGISKENLYGEGDRWQDVLDVNLSGSYFLVNEALPYLRKSTYKYRHVLLVSSILAHMGVPGHSAYCAAKAGVLGMMRSWAVEWAPENILVNAISPGWVDTDMAKESITRISQLTGFSYEEEYKRQMDLVPLKKAATPQNIAQLANFLISPEQTSITGEEVQINNGASMI